MKKTLKNIGSRVAKGAIVLLVPFMFGCNNKIKTKNVLVKEEYAPVWFERSENSETIYRVYDGKNEFYISAKGDPFNENDRAFIKYNNRDKSYFNLVKIDSNDFHRVFQDKPAFKLFDYEVLKDL